MRLHNTLTRQQETFEPLRDGTVRMYTCGLTVYSRGHIGNFRTFVCVDVLRRTLKYVGGWKCARHKFTDVDDKTIGSSARRKGPARVHRPVRPGLSRRCGEAGDRAGGGDAPGDRPGQSGRDGENDSAARGTGHTYRSDGRSTSRFRLCPGTASWRGWITRASSPGRAWTRTNTTRRTRAISCCGRRPSRVSRRGTAESGPAGPDGTSSARQWR